MNAECILEVIVSEFVTGLDKGEIEKGKNQEEFLEFYFR